jgi:hypothetical protein
LRESFQVSAVVVNHEVFLNPSQTSSAMGIKLVGLPCSVGPPCSIGGCNFEIPVVCCEGCLGPISFHQSSSCGPVVSIPEARVNLHWLALGEGNADLFSILEYSYGNVINHEAENRSNIKIIANRVDSMKYMGICVFCIISLTLCAGVSR